MNLLRGAVRGIDLECRCWRDNRAYDVFFGYPAWVFVIPEILWLAALVVSFGTGHHGFGGRGNTDFMIVLAALFITAIIIIPKYVQQTPCYRMKAALENLDRFQKEYHTRNSLYASQLSILDFKHDPDVEVLVIFANTQFYVATASIPGCKEKDGTPRTMTWDSMRGGLQ